MYKTIDIIDTWQNSRVGKKLETGLSWEFAKAKYIVSNGQLDTDLDGYTDGILKLNGEVIGITEVKTTTTGKDTMLNRKKILTQLFGYIYEHYGECKNCPYKVLLLETGTYVAYIPFDSIKSIYTEFKLIFETCTKVSPSKIWYSCPEIRAFMRSTPIVFYSWKVSDIEYSEFIQKIIAICQ